MKALLQLHLNDQQFYCLLGATYIRGLTVVYCRDKVSCILFTSPYQPVLQKSRKSHDMKYRSQPLLYIKYDDTFLIFIGVVELRKQPRVVWQLTLWQPRLSALNKHWCWECSAVHGIPFETSRGPIYTLGTCNHCITATKCHKCIFSM